VRRSLAPLLALACGYAFAADRSTDPALLYGAHRESGRFFNPWARFEWSLWRLVRWQLSPNRFDKSEEPHIPTVANDGSRFSERESSASITWIGHATVAIHDDHDVVLTDPHFGERALIPRRQVEPGVPIESIPPDAFAVISHNHYDHLDAYTVENLPDTVGWYVPLGLGDWFRKRGREQVVELDWWESARRGRWTITCLPSQHWSRRIEHGLNSTLWCSWLLDSGARRYYFGGDTGYFYGFAEFGQLFEPIDVAILPIGAYEPRWFMRYQHLNPADAYRAFGDLRARYMIPVHWGTFDLTDEPLDLPPKVLREAVTNSGGDPARVPILAVGERWRLPERKPGT
jgi:N-acyl-phosphatidylethanolamine-hydrolysing phospholipase D